MATFRIKRLTEGKELNMCMQDFQTVFHHPARLGPMSFSTRLTLLDDIYISIDEMARILIRVNILHIHVTRNSIHICSYICLPHHKISYVHCFDTQVYIQKYKYILIANEYVSYKIYQF